MMPFFRSKSYSNYLTRHSIYKSKKFFAPLQVRTHKYVALLKQKKFSGKRALSWVLVMMDRSKSYSTLFNTTLHL